MTPHLFLFTIGPVQSFIAQARKTIDLKAGSDILSRLTLIAIQAVKDKFQAEIIYPYLPTQEESASMPNKFLVKIPATTINTQTIGTTIENIVREAWQTVAVNTLSKIGNDDEAFKKHFLEQVAAHLEVYWIFEPINDTTDYRRAYQSIERNLVLIKNMRAFDQLPPDERGRKCSVTGERDALIFRKNEKGTLPQFADQQKVRKIDIHKVMLSEGEGLSAVSATKRFFKPSDQKASFNSTAGIAAMSFKKAVKKSKIAFQFANYKGMFDADQWDEQLLFPENMTINYFKKHVSEKDANKAKLLQLTSMLGALRQKAKEEKLPNISSYYALLSFDGDHMGTIWSGNKEYLEEGVDLHFFHQKLAERLYHFAQLARAYLDDGRGQTVYAGGDDFTGFINLDHLFEVLEYLYTLFQIEVSNQLIDDRDEDRSKHKSLLKQDVKITFSAGVCIAHYKTPLEEVVRSAQKAQKDAKEKGGRDAFTIHLMKRSGEIQRAIIKWGTKADSLVNLTALKICVHYQQTGCFSNTFITSISRELMNLIGRKKDLDKAFNPIIETELKRLIQRAKIDEGLKTYLLENPGTSIPVIVEKMQQAVLRLFDYDLTGDRIQNFLHFLEIADFLNRQPDHAN